MNDKFETKRYIYSNQYPFAHSPDLDQITPALSGADWGRRAKVSTCDVLCSDEDGPTRYVRSWAPTKVIPSRVLVKTDLEVVLQWVSEHRGIPCSHVAETVSIVVPEAPAAGFLRVYGEPTIQVWRIAYDWNERPLLAQLETHHPYLGVTYNRWLPWERTLERQRADREWRVPA